MPVDGDLIVPTPRFHRHLVAEAMNRLLALPESPDAVFCHNDLLAIGAMHALTRAGVRVPEGIAVVGIDGIQEGEYSSPTLTTIAPDKPGSRRWRQHAGRDHRGCGIRAGGRGGAAPVGRQGQHHQGLSGRLTALVTRRRPGQ
ncbi:substrate-binding domain-containing protein [Streptomyces cyaneochromogenes]|uniref:substrate-binding domain-containing protein n=1 Tax=Streptomyces cyaneochromogenes TaxID=2496836 RepID=UPI001E2B56A8|nr:substrate-binding domain-containing protein [Streptomyces cyaneochromogenes]